MIDKENILPASLQSTGKSRKVKLVGNSAVLVAANLLNQRKIQHLKKMSHVRFDPMQPVLWANRIKYETAPLRTRSLNKENCVREKEGCFSNINLLKKEALMLEEDDLDRKIRFSTFEIQENPDKAIVNHSKSYNNRISIQKKICRGRAVHIKQNHRAINWNKIEPLSKLDFQSKVQSTEI